MKNDSKKSTEKEIEKGKKNEACYISHDSRNGIIGHYNRPCHVYLKKNPELVTDAGLFRFSLFSFLMHRFS